MSLGSTNLFTVLRQTSEGKTPLQLLCGDASTSPSGTHLDDISRYLMEMEQQAVQCLQDATEHVATEQIGLPDLCCTHLGLCRTDFMATTTRLGDNNDCSNTNFFQG